MDVFRVVALLLRGGGVVGGVGASGGRGRGPQSARHDGLGPALAVMVGVRRRPVVKVRVSMVVVVRVGQVDALRHAPDALPQHGVVGLRCFRRQLNVISPATTTEEEEEHKTTDHFTIGSSLLLLLFVMRACVSLSCQLATSLGLWKLLLPTAAAPSSERGAGARPRPAAASAEAGGGRGQRAASPPLPP